MATTTKKSAPKKSAAAKKVAPVAATGMSYEAMIAEAIAAHPAESRAGLGRPTIKKYIHQKHPVTSKIPSASFNNLISKAIVRGADKGTFTLPKGISGKVKLAPKAKATVEKVQAAPAPPAPKPAAAKKAPAKKAAAAKPKKTTAAATKTAKKPAAAAKKAPAKKAAAKPAAKKTAKQSAKK
ncbi:unnamed protein product [Tilletia caries]|uniref:Histone H1 n=1 Tax=Tilletia caries TaxID=13290 RepID=A0ABN7J5Z9_9BASI|nr:unnamed protein product [Tilletia caries]